MEDFNIRGSFCLLISSSKDPSNTINIKPVVPSTGKMGSKFGICSLKKLVVVLTTKPRRSSKITDGIFVLAADMSNKYAIKTKTQSAIMIGIVIF
jgi:hypothetical protein